MGRKHPSGICPVCLLPVGAPDGIIERHHLESRQIVAGQWVNRKVCCPMSGQPQFVWTESETREAVAGRSGGVCEACGKQRATDMHHRIPRSVGGGWHPANIVHLCRGCHDWIEEGCHRDEARARGLLLRSHQEPTTVAIRRFTGITTLLSDNVAGSAPKQRGTKKRL